MSFRDEGLRRHHHLTAGREVQHLHFSDPDEGALTSLGARLDWERELVRQLQDESLAPALIPFRGRLLARFDIPRFRKNEPFEWRRVDVVLERGRIVTLSSGEVPQIGVARERWRRRGATGDGSVLLALIVSEIVEATRATLARLHSHLDRLIGTRREGADLEEGETLERLGEQVHEVARGIQLLLRALARVEPPGVPRLHPSARAELFAQRDGLLLLQSDADHLIEQVEELEEYVTGHEGVLDLESPQIIEVAASVGERRLHRLTAAHAMTGLVGGMAVSFGAVAMAFTAGPFLASLGAERAHLLGALTFPIGFIILIVGKGELFTENFFVPVTSAWMRRGKWGHLASLWALTLVGNLAGAALLAWLGTRSGVIEGGPADFLRELAARKVEVPLWTGLVKSIFAGWVITLMTWLILAARGWGPRMAVIWMMGFLLVAGHFHHVVISATEIFLGIGLGADVSLWQWFTRSFLVSLAGNLVGGVVFVTIVGFVQAHGLQVSREQHAEALRSRRGPRVRPRRPVQA